MISNQKKDHEKKPWLMLCLLSLLFYSAMLLLTIFAKDIHIARLPKVTAEPPGKQKFSYMTTGESGTIKRTMSVTALPKDMVDSGKVFVLETVTENDFIFYYAKQISVTVDETKENADYYAISSGLSMWGDTIITTGYETLKHGDEVYPIRDNLKNETLSTDDLFQ